MKTEINTMIEGRKEDKAALIGLEKSIKDLKKMYSKSLLLIKIWT